MTRVSVLLWLAITMVAVPLLALPLWLMKGVMITLAFFIAVIAYSLEDGRPAPLSQLELQLDHEPAVDAKDKNPSEKKGENRKTSSPNQNITDPKGDSFLAMNTYRQRTNRRS